MSGSARALVRPWFDVPRRCRAARARRSRFLRRCDGQSSVELLGAIPLLLVVVLAAAELLAAGRRARLGLVCRECGGDGRAPRRRPIGRRALRGARLGPTAHRGARLRPPRACPSHAAEPAARPVGSPVDDRGGRCGPRAAGVGTHRGRSGRGVAVPHGSRGARSMSAVVLERLRDLFLTGDAAASHGPSAGSPSEPCLRRSVSSSGLATRQRPGWPWAWPWPPRIAPRVRWSAVGRGTRLSNRRARAWRAALRAGSPSGLLGAALPLVCAAAS